MTGHDRLLDEIADLRRKLAAAEAQRDTALKRIADLREFIDWQHARVKSLQRQLLDGWTR